MDSEKIPRYLYPIEDELLPIPYYFEINEESKLKIKSVDKIKRKTKNKRKNKKLKSHRKIKLI